MSHDEKSPNVVVSCMNGPTKQTERRGKGPGVSHTGKGRFEGRSENTRKVTKLTATTRETAGTHAGTGRGEGRGRGKGRGEGRTLRRRRNTGKCTSGKLDRTWDPKRDMTNITKIKQEVQIQNINNTRSHQDIKIQISVSLFPNIADE